MSSPASQLPLRPRSTSTLLRLVRPAFSWKFTTLWLILVVNVVLVSLYLWSRGGSTTHVRLEAIGSHYRAFVDGRLVAEGSFEGRPEGGIGFRLPRDDLIPSLPKPAGIDSVRVTDAATGEANFEDTFGGSRSDLWKVQSGDWHIDDGVFSTSRRGTVTTGPQPWGDYVLEAKLRNVTEATVYVRLEDSRNAVALGMRPVRHTKDSSLKLLENGTAAQREGGARLELDRGQTIQSITAMLLRPYPTVALIVVGTILLAFLLRLPWLESRLLAEGRFLLQLANPLILGLAVGAFVLLWYLNYVIGDAMPHVPDSVLYLFQAKTFASFQLTADIPPVRESFSIFHPHMLQVLDGRWFPHYPFGHPLFLAFGQFFGAPWLVPPLLGAASVALIFGIGKHLYGITVGLLAALLLLFSPFFQMTASNFMSHNTAAFTILACLFLLVLPTKERIPAMFLSGVFLGLLFNIRPLTAVAFIPVLALFMAYELLRAGPQRATLLRQDLAFAAGGVLLLLAYFLYNQATTGDFLKAPYALQGTYTSNTFGFSGSHSLAFGLQNQQLLLSLMLLVANGWPTFIGLAFAALPFLLGSRYRWDYFLAASALAIAAANIFYRNASVMHGPRFWYETMPFLMLLTARGVQCLTDAGSTAGDWLARRFRRAPAGSSVGITGFAVLSLVAGLIVFSAYGWMLEQRNAWSRIDFTPQKISMLEGFNFTDGRLLDRADQLNLKDALVLVEQCPHWWCYGSVFWTNSPNLDGEVVWAERQNNPDDLALLEHFQGRKLYLADYGSGSIRPVTQAEIVSSIEVAEEGPQAAEGETLTPGERDQIRRQDLETLRQALERRAEQTGRYPDTGGRIQTLCVYPNLDAACVLESVLPELPTDPLGASTSNGYWYMSDGTSFLLIARQEEMTAAPSQCPEFVVRNASEGTRYCVQGPAP